MPVLRAGRQYRFNVFDPQRGNWPPGWQSRVASALARLGYRGTLTWLRDPVPWWSVFPSKCGGDAVIVWLDVAVAGEDLDTTTLEAALNQAIGCMEIGQVGDKPDTPPDHATDPRPPAGSPRWLRALVVGGAIYLGMSVLAAAANAGAAVRRLVGGTRA